MVRFISIFVLSLAGAGAVFGDADAFTIFKQKENVNLPGKFTFCRIEYNSYGGYGEAEYDYDGRHWKRWQTDYPESDENFLFRLSELTLIDPNPHPIVRKLTDEDLYNYPLIFMSDPGWQELSKEEKQGLRNYKLPKEKQETAADLTIEEVKAIIEEAKANPPKRVPRKKKTS